MATGSLRVLLRLRRGVARLDVLESGPDGNEVGDGTTHVDVNNPLRGTLSRIGTDDPLHLRVGPDELAVTTLDGPVVEKKVPLPDRCLRGFAEAQVIAAGFDLRAELPVAEAVRFLRSLPRGTAAVDALLVLAARGQLDAGRLVQMGEAGPSAPDRTDPTGRRLMEGTAATPERTRTGLTRHGTHAVRSRQNNRKKNCKRGRTTLYRSVTDRS
jgi:hypothetical protein